MKSIELKCLLFVRVRTVEASVSILSTFHSFDFNQNANRQCAICISYTVLVVHLLCLCRGVQEIQYSDGLSR